LATQLASLTISNFRSVLGEITVPLDAPVVLIHGLNGSGKTSILAALELALTGSIESLERADSNYKQHLKHVDAETSEIRLATRNGNPKSTVVRITTSGISGVPLLSTDDAQCFVERCNLAQSSLSRLLEIYQHTDRRDPDSALTKFVKELLGLDQLDALIEGLFAAGDLRRIRNLVPDFRAAEERCEELEGAVASARLEFDRFAEEEKLLIDGLKKAATDLTVNVDPERPESLRSHLAIDLERRQLSEITRTMRELSAIREEWNSLPPRKAQEEQAIAEQYKLAEAAISEWTAGPGTLLEGVIESLRSKFPDLPALAFTDPEFARSTAMTAVSQDVALCTRRLEQDDSDARTIIELNRKLADNRNRRSAVDLEIAGLLRNSSSLSQTLAAILPHIDGNQCPVCGRDFSEVSSQPLSAQVSGQIAKLANDAGVLQNASREKETLESVGAELQREVEAVTSRRLSDEGRSLLRTRLKELSDALSKLSGIASDAKRGAADLTNVSLARGRLAEFTRREQRITAIRQRLVEIAEIAGIEREDSEGTPDLIARLEEAFSKQESALLERQQRKLGTLEDLDKLRKVREGVRQQKQLLSSAEAKLEKVRGALFAAGERRAFAKEVSDAARHARTDVVRRVFSASLNGIWRELFIRLAPYERFVPAFAVPEGAPAPVIAELETLERRHGRGGSPAIMLSAANLNVAALTLFLALHLVAKPKLPWLILDDPIQSMDDVHVSQFAALLRTLSRQQQRQLIVAVHERPLFEYLQLELSPAWAGDKLITIELRQNAQGDTAAVHHTREWQPDRAVVNQ